MMPPAVLFGWSAVLSCGTVEKEVPLCYNIKVRMIIYAETVII